MPCHFECDWELKIEHDPQEIGEPYELYFFLGSIPSSPSEWRPSPSCLFEPIFSQAEGTSTEFRDLNGYLDHHSKGTLNDDSVLPYLRKHLSWRIKMRYGREEIDYSNLESLKVTLYRGADDATGITLRSAE